MPNYRFYHNSKLNLNSEETLDTGISHQISNVLRLKANDQISLFNGHGYEAKATIKNINRKNVIIIITDSYQKNLESPLHIHLGQAISKNAHMDFAIQKAVELGVTEITPIITTRTQAKVSSLLSSNKLEHWHKIIIAACSQCGRNTIPSINQPIKLTEWIEKVDNTDGTRIMLSPTATTNINKLNIDKNRIIHLFIGPEGGLTEQEVQLTSAHAFHGLKLGPRILRTETAAIAAITAIQLQAGDLA